MLALGRSHAVQDSVERRFVAGAGDRILVRDMSVRTNKYTASSSDAMHSISQSSRKRAHVISLKLRILVLGLALILVTTDVTSSSAVGSLVRACVRRRGRIDILINNVGHNEPGGPVEISEQIWDCQDNINLKSVYLTCHHVLADQRV